MMVSETEDFKDGFIMALMEAGKSAYDAEKAWEQYLLTTATKDVILGVVGDMVADLLYYNRKEDDDLPRGAIEDAITHGHITVDEIVAKFRKGLEDAQ